MPLDCPITIVIITRDRAAELEKTLERLCGLPERAPIIVVDNASSVPPPALPAGVQLIQLARNAGAAGRNVGAAQARTPYVAFSDDDSSWAAGALHRAVGILNRHARLGLVAARVLVGDAGRPDPMCREMRESPLPRLPDLPGPYVLGFMACAAVVRRAAFLRAGGFHERFGVGGEERLLAIDLARRGWGLAYCEDVVAHHYPANEGVRPGRQARLVRNALWTAWLRYRTRDALAFTWLIARHALRSSAARSGLARATLGLPWILRERDAVDVPLQRHLALVASQ